MNINWEVLFSGLAGTVIGGIISWLSTVSAMKKQFNHEEDLRLKAEDKKLYKTLYSVHIEVQHNILALEAIKKIMEVKEMDMVNYFASNQDNGLRNTKWLEFAGDLVDSYSPDLVNKLSTFYYNLSLEINNQLNSLDRIMKHIPDAYKCLKLLDDEIQRVKARLEY